MTPSDDELERRLRDAFAAKAHQVSPDDLDSGREAEFADRLAALSTARRKRRIFAGVGIGAAAAAAAGIVALAILPDNQAPTNAAGHSTTTFSSTANSTAGSAASGGQGAAGPTPRATRSPLGEPSRSSGMSQQSGPSTPASTSSPASSTSAATSERTALSDGGPTASGQSSEPTEPPALPTGLPQAGSVDGGTTYAGPVPLPDPSGGADRMLALPDGTKWQVEQQGDTSMSIQVTFQPTDISAYWTDTLPSDGWTQAGDGWQFPGSSYTVGAISKSGKFTVSW